MNKKKILLILLAILVISVISVGIWQRNNIKAIVDSRRYSNKEITQKIDNNKQELKKELKKSAPNLIRDFTPEEKKEIASGKVSIDEMVKKVMSEKSNNTKASNSISPTNTAKKATPSDSNKEIKTSEKEDKQSNIDSAVSKCVGEMNGLEAYYMGQIGSLASSAASKGNRQSISEYISRASSLEGQCDAKVNGALSSLKEKLESLGGDVSIVSSLKHSYENEKSLKKAYYLSLLK